MNLVYTTSPEIIDTDSEEYKIAQKYFEFYLQDCGFAMDIDYSKCDSIYTKYICEINYDQSNHSKIYFHDDFTIETSMYIQMGAILVENFRQLAILKSLKLIAMEDCANFYFTIQDVINEINVLAAEGKYKDRDLANSNKIKEAYKILKDNNMLPRDFKLSHE
jgi:hypothetical protein